MSKDSLLQFPLPEEVHLLIRLPNVNNMDEIRKHLWLEYHIDVDPDPESDYYLMLYYNNDLRSLMGFLHDWDEVSAYLILWPEYYVDKDRPWDSYYNSRWKKLVENSITDGELD